jgi:hypothetical protein
MRLRVQYMYYAFCSESNPGARAKNALVVHAAWNLGSIAIDLKEPKQSSPLLLSLEALKIDHEHPR